MLIWIWCLQNDKSKINTESMPNEKVLRFFKIWISMNGRAGVPGERILIFLLFLCRKLFPDVISKNDALFRPKDLPKLESPYKYNFFLSL